MSDTLQTGRYAQRRSAPNVRQAIQRDSKPYVPPRPAAPRPPANTTYSTPVNYIRPIAPAPQTYAYQAPAYNPPAPAPVYNPPAPSYGGGGFSGGGQSFAAPAPAPAPAAPPPPPPPRQLNEKEWLAGDADFKDQTNEYDRALSEFQRRIGAKKKNFDDDARLSLAATAKNQTNTLNDTGEDFAARGLAYSGLFADRQNKVRESFGNQNANIETVRNRNKANADEELGDYRSENQLSRGNAKRQALARMAAQQALINAGGAF